MTAQQPARSPGPCGLGPAPRLPTAQCGSSSSYTSSKALMILLQDQPSVSEAGPSGLRVARLRVRHPESGQNGPGPLHRRRGRSFHRARAPVGRAGGADYGVTVCFGRDRHVQACDSRASARMGTWDTHMYNRTGRRRRRRRRRRHPAGRLAQPTPPRGRARCHTRPGPDHSGTRTE